ncbi:MAG: O-antigen ligase family protein [Devosia sp.]
MSRLTFGSALGGVLLLLILASYGVGGVYVPYLLLIPVIIALPYLVYVHAGRPLVPDFAGWGFLAAFTLLAIAFTLGGTQPSDGLIAANFIWLLLFIPLQALFNRLANPKAAIVLARLALLGVALTFASAVYQRVGLGFERVGYLNSDAIRIANSAVILGFLSLVGLVADSGWRRWLYLTGPLLAVGVALLAGTRGAIATIVVLTVVAALLLVKRRRVAMLVAAGLAVVAGLALFVAAQLHVPRVESLLDTIGQLFSGNQVADGSASIRLAMLQAAWGAFLASPWVGHGWQHMMTAILPYLPAGQETISAGQPHLHNDIADFAVGGGLVGLVAYATILATPLVAAWRSVRDSLYRARLFAIAIAVTAYATLGLNSLMFGFEVHTSLYAGLCAAILGFCRERGPIADAVRNDLVATAPGRLVKIAAGAALLLALVLPTIVGLITPYLLVVIGLGLWLVLLFTGRLPTAYSTPTAKALLIAFAALLVLFTLTMQSWRDPLYAFNFTMLFLYGPLAWLLTRVADRWRFGRIAVMAATGVGLSLAMVLYSSLSGAIRPVGLNIGPIVLSNAALALAVVATAGAMASTKRASLLLPLTIAAAIATSLITQSRGPLIAVVPLLLLTGLMLWRARFARQWWIVLAGGAAIALVAIAAMLLGSERLAHLPQIVTQLLGGGETADRTTNIRLALYEAGWRTFLDAPWFGHGWVRLMSSAVAYLDPRYLDDVKILRQLHNDVLNFAVAGGVAGVGVYLLIIATPLIVALRSARDSMWFARVYAISSLTIVYIGGGLTDLMFGQEFHTALYVVLVAVVQSLCREPARNAMAPT